MGEIEVGFGRGFADRRAPRRREPCIRALKAVVRGARRQLDVVQLRQQVALHMPIHARTDGLTVCCARTAPGAPVCEAAHDDDHHQQQRRSADDDHQLRRNIFPGKKK
jgi:hypothetical protein